MSTTATFTRTTLGVALALAALLPPTGAAHAQAPPVCLARSEMLEALRSRFAEQPAAFALADSGQVVELVMVPDGQTWTLLASEPDGRSCVLASGRWWTVRPEGLPGLLSGYRP